MICVNKKGIFAIVGVAIIIIVVFAVPQPTETPPMIQDSTEINDESKVGVGDKPQTPQISDEGSIEAGLNVGESPAISDTGEVEVEEGLIVSESPEISDTGEVEAGEESEYYVDENGTKHYVIEVGDAPMLN